MAAEMTQVSPLQLSPSPLCGVWGVHVQLQRYLFLYVMCFGHLSISKLLIMEPFGIGILGCARIAKKNCRAATAAECQITAISSRSEEKAQSFIGEVLGEQQAAPLIFAGDDAYNRLLQSTSSNINAVYIPLPTKLHEQYVAKALSSNKHILLEKPVAESAERYQDMLAAASENGKLLMDGTMFVHHPRTAQFVKAIPNPNRVSFNFTFDGGEQFLKHDIRVKKDGDFMGCIGDLGWYCVRMGLLVFTALDAGALESIVKEVQVVRYQLNEEGVPIDAECLIHFSEVRYMLSQICMTSAVCLPKNPYEYSSSTRTECCLFTAASSIR